MAMALLLISRCLIMAAIILVLLQCCAWPASQFYVDASSDAVDDSSRNLASPVYESYFDNEFNEVVAWLNKQRTKIENTVFMSYDSQGVAYRSTVYTYDDFLDSLKRMAVNGVGGGDDRLFFYIGQTDNKGIIHGLVNVAAFLAHAMTVSIKYDLCDEFNVDATDFTEKYAISNSCGQWGRSYNEVCTGDDALMTCEVDLDMTITATDALGGEKAPPPLQCGPKQNDMDFTGYWDAEVGLLSETYPYANRAGTLHYEGCCWWGRGVLLTRGTCNLGRANQYLGRPAAAKGWLNFYDIDICIYPEIICRGQDTRGLRWSVGYFEWMDRVQTFQNTTEGVDYMNELDIFVETGFIDIIRFIDVVGRALPFGCFESNCDAAEQKVAQERRTNFVNLVYNVFDLPELVLSTPFPTPPPTQQPTQEGNPIIPPALTPPPSPASPPPTKLPTSPTFIDKPPTPPPFPSTNFPNSPESTNEQASAPQGYFTATICVGLGSTSVPIGDCSEYVNCVNGNIVSRQACPAGLLFDPQIGMCNWSSAVPVCNTPTWVPTPRPIQRTPRPVKQTQQVTNFPPTASPLANSWPFLTATVRPSLAQQTSMDPPSNINSGKEVVPNKPTYSPTVYDPELISLPSGALMARSNLGSFWFTVIGFIILICP